MRLSEDIVLDEEAFSEAVSEFEALGKQLSDLRADIEDMLNILKEGFNTPAGVKFINSCETNLFKPLDDQALVIEHIAETLGASRTAYQTVFREYEELQKTINNAKH